MTFCRETEWWRVGGGGCPLWVRKVQTCWKLYIILGENKVLSKLAILKTQNSKRIIFKTRKNSPVNRVLSCLSSNRQKLDIFLWREWMRQDFTVFSSFPFVDSKKTNVYTHCFISFTYPPKTKGNLPKSTKM